MFIIASQIAKGKGLTTIRLKIEEVSEEDFSYPARLRKSVTIPQSTLTTLLTQSSDDPTHSWYINKNHSYQNTATKTTIIEGVSSTGDTRACGSGTNLAITANPNNTEYVVDVIYNNRGGGGGVSDGGQSPPIPSVGKTLLNTNANLLPITTASDTFNNLKNLVKIDKGSNSANSGSYSGSVNSGYRSKGVGGFKTNGPHIGPPNYVEGRNTSRPGSTGGASGHFSTGYSKNSAKIRQHDSEVSPRPRRPYQSDSSSSRYYNKNSELLSPSDQSGPIGGGLALTSEGTERGGHNSTSGSDNRRPYQTSSGNQHPSEGNRGLNSSSGGSFRSQKNSKHENGNVQQNQYGHSNAGFSSKQSYNSRGLDENNENSRKPQKDDYSNYRDYEESSRQRYNNCNSLDRANNSGRFRSGEGSGTLPVQSLRQSGASDSYNRSSDRAYNNRTPPVRSNNASTSHTSAQSNVNTAGNSCGASSGLNQQPSSSSTPPPTTGRWVPPSLRPQHGLTQSEKNDAVFRKVRGILNKLTPEKFQELSEDLLQLDLNSIVILNGVILLIFDKALDEPKYSSMYAQLCKRISEEAPLFEEESNNSCTFLRLLIAVCRDKFNNRLKKDIPEFDSNNQFKKNTKPQSQQINGENDTDEEERRHLAKQRMLGNVKFIGELNKLNMLSNHVLHQCIQELLDKKKKRSASSQEMCEDMECLSQLLKTCGKNLDSEQGKELMNQYFEKLERRSKSTEYPPRIRFMLKDVIELRENNWVPRKVATTEGPVPIKQIRTDDDSMMRTPFASRSRDNRGNDRDGDNWMNKFHLNLQPGFNDMFGSLSVTGSSPIMTPYNSNNSNRSFNNQRSNQNNSFNNRYKINQNGMTNNRDDIRNNSHNNNNNRDQSQYANQMLNSKEMAPRFKRNLMSTNQDSVENLQMRPAANSLLFKAASQNQKLPTMLPISSPPISNVSSTGKDAKFTTNAQYPLLATPSLHLLNSSRPSSTPSSSEYENKTSSSTNGVSDQSLKSTSSPSFSTYTPTIESCSETDLNEDERKYSPNVFEKPNANQKLVAKTNVNSSSSTKQKKEKLLNKEEIMKKALIYVKEHLFYDENNMENNEEESVKQLSLFMDGFLQLKIPEKCMKDVCVGLLMDVLVKGDEKYFLRVIKILQLLRKQSIIKPNLVIEVCKQIINKINELESLNPNIMTSVANLLSKFVCDSALLKLNDIANLTDNGQHYPLVFLFLQQLHKSIGKEALDGMFHSSKINLMNSLPEADRNKTRLVEVLDGRNLSFLCPLLKVQTEMLKQLQSEPNAANFFKWIKSNVDSKYYKDPGFITALMTVVLKFITQETSLAEGSDIKKHPDKIIIEKEETMLHKYCPILQTFLESNVELQLIAVYAMQVFCYNEKFPKGLLCRWFKYLYEAEVIEEEPFILWKEEISDKYPGKGTALFQVNTWLTWLEQAESEDDED